MHFCIGFSKLHRKSAHVLNRQSEYSATGSVARQGTSCSTKIIIIEFPPIQKLLAIFNFPVA